MKPWLILLSAVWAQTCPQYTCETLSSGVCAENNSQGSSTIVKVNKSLCPSGTYCAYSDVSDWVDTSTFGDLYNCINTDSTS